MKGNSYYDYVGLNDIVISRVLQVAGDDITELYVGCRYFCDLYVREICDISDDSIVYKVEDITPYAIRKYDGMSGKPMTVGYANLNNAIKWVKRNCDNVDGDIAVNRNYRIDDCVDINGSFYKFRIEHINSLDY